MAADETSRLRCQLDEARALVRRQSSVIEDKDAELERNLALIKEKDIELARKEAAVKDMEAQLALKEAQDEAPALKDAMIKAPVVRASVSKANGRPDLRAHSHWSQRLVPPQDTDGLTYKVRKRRVPIESWEAADPDLWPRNHRSQHLVPPQDRHGRLLGGATVTDLPTIIAALPLNTTVINLPGSGLTGTVPTELGKFTQLAWLDLSSNQLTGTLPAELGNLGQLEALVFNDNQLTGTLPPQLGNLTQMLRVCLQNNKLTGTLPPELGKQTHLHQLYLSNNGLTGTIPPELGNLTEFRTLDLSSNRLTGTIPEELSNLYGLNYLLLNNNQLDGTIPPGLKAAMSIRLDANGLTGTIPPDLGNRRLIRYLHLEGNALTGKVPDEFGSMRRLKELNLAGNHLTGTLPELIVQLKALDLLDVSDNRGMTGIFPDTTNATFSAILAANCSFTSAGAVGSAVRKISFANNNFTDLPAEWVNLPGVLELDLSNNHISVWRPRGVLDAFSFGIYCGGGPLEPRLNWPVIQSVKLSGNPIGLNITTRDFLWSMAYFASLSELYAAGCHLQGVMPNGIGGIGVEMTTTGDCALSVQNVVAGFQGLLTLDLSANNITAILPPPPQRLSTADLHGNPLVELNAEWYRVPRTLEVWNNSFLRANVTPPFRPNGCLNTGTSALEADPFGFVTKREEDAFQCTALCAGVTTRYKHDASLNVSSLCRCRAGKQGAATNCTGCPPDTYSDSDAKDTWAMVRTCRPCPEHSSTDNVENATSVDRCKCQAGWFMATIATGGSSTTTMSACKRCKQGRFMDTLPGAIQDTQCFCNASYDGLRALQGNCGCADGQYMDHVARACRRCDKVAEECTWASQIELSLLPPVIKASYWAAPPPEVGPDEASTFSKHNIWRCFSKDTCLRNGTCAVGRSGTACSLCVAGMYGGPDGPCKPCPYKPEQTRKNLLYILLIGPAATIAAHTSLNLQANKLANVLASVRTSGKQAFKYLQMLGVMAGFNIDWPPVARDFLTDVSRITIALPQVAGAACLVAGQSTATVEMGFRWLMPVAGLLSACLSALLLAPIGFLSRKPQCFKLVRMNHWDVLRVSLWGMALFYSTLLQFGTQVLACTPSPNGMRTVVTFPHLHCGDGGEWERLAAISCAFLLVFVGAVFLGIYAAWRCATRALVESNFESSGWWGFLFDDYRYGWGHWLMITMAKDAALVVIATAGASDGPSQLLATAALSTAYSYIVLRDQPFKNPSNNVVEAWTMMSMAVLSVFTAGMGFQSAPDVGDVTELYSDGASDPEYTKRERALLALQCFTFVGPAGIVLYQLLCASEQVRNRLPALIRPPTQEERAKWNRDFLGSLKLDQATAAELWRVMDRFDVIDNAKFRDLMSTSTATLGIIPSADGVNIKRMVRKRFANVARTSAQNLTIEEPECTHNLHASRQITSPEVLASNAFGDAQVEEPECASRQISKASREISSTEALMGNVLDNAQAMKDVVTL